jgi:hypothetical protein
MAVHAPPCSSLSGARADSFKPSRHYSVTHRKYVSHYYILKPSSAEPVSQALLRNLPFPLFNYTGTKVRPIEAVSDQCTYIQYVTQRKENIITHLMVIFLRHNYREIMLCTAPTIKFGRICLTTSLYILARRDITLLIF